MREIKIGEWVENIRCVNQRIIKQVIGCKEHLDTLTVGSIANGVNVVLKSDVKLWQPKEGEFVIPRQKLKNHLMYSNTTKSIKDLSLSRSLEYYLAL